MANFPNFENQKQTIDSYSKKVNIDNYDEIMSLIYKYIKGVTPEYYLVDLTISQFFYRFKNNLDRLGVVGCDGCLPGVFMLLTEDGKNIATTLLNDGYIKLDELTFKAYMDAFTISFRNGLYYEDTNDFSYKVNYSIDDYIRFLNGEDDQIRYEGRENLGYQKRPLKNSSLEFRR